MRRLRRGYLVFLVLKSAAWSVSIRLRRHRIPFGPSVGPYLREPKKLVEPKSFPTAGALSRVVTLATSVWPFQTTCLIRSLVLAKLLRSYGYPAVVTLGVFDKDSRQDWLAHAWVEIRDGASQDRIRLMPLDKVHTS